MKKTVVYFLLLSALAAGNANAYYQDNSLTARYYRREIGTNEYLDRSGYTAPSDNSMYIYHSNGSRSVVRPGYSGQYNVYYY